MPSYDEKTSQRLCAGLEVSDCLMINPLTKLLPKSLNSKPSRHVIALHSLLSRQLREFICTVFCSLFQLIVQLYLENKGDVLETSDGFLTIRLRERFLILIIVHAKLHGSIAKFHERVCIPSNKFYIHSSFGE